MSLINQLNKKSIKEEEGEKNEQDWGSDKLFGLGRKIPTFLTKVIDSKTNNENIMNYNFIPQGVSIVNILMTDSNTFLLSTKGRLYSWGAYSHVLGRRVKNKDESRIPGEVIGFPNKLLSIAVGFKHVLALDTEGKIYSWGRNDFGQLGHESINMEKKEVLSPKEIDFFSKIKIAAIYAGANCSFAIAFTGALYVWGENTEGQLGFSGEELVFEPKLLDNTPWQMNIMDTHIIFGKNSRGYVFQYKTLDKGGQTTTDENALKKMIFTLREYEERNKKLESQISKYETELYGKSADKYASIQKDVQNDPILKELQDQLKKIETETKEMLSQENNLNIEIEAIGKELYEFKVQLDDISRKESELLNKRENYEIEVRRKKFKENNVFNKDELEILAKKQKTIKELAMTNENIKNTIYQKQALNEEELGLKNEERKKLLLKIEELQKKKKLYEELMIERKKSITNRYINENKSEMSKIISKIHDIYRQLEETTSISEIAKSSTNLKGLPDLINDSNKTIMKIKNELNNVKVKTSTASFEFISKIIEILEDDIAQRIKINDYTYAILLQTHNKLEQFLIENQEFDEKNSNDKRVLEDRKEKEKKILETKKQKKRKE